MPRRSDDNFHRFLWVTLVVVAFIFTLILTSVFVDIDGLLAKRSSPALKQQLVTDVAGTDFPPEVDGSVQEFPSSEEDTDEIESTFRTKRSLEPSNYLLQVKNPEMKKILTHQLASLLEALDEEETSKDTNSENVVQNKEDKNNMNAKHLSAIGNIKNTGNVMNNKDGNSKFKNEIENKDLLHLAMHNILLQGIIGHMDLNEVYKKVQMLIKSFKSNTNPDAAEINESKLNTSKSTESMKMLSHNLYNDEDIFFNELIGCEQLQKQILQSQTINILDKKDLPKDSQMLIKTTVEIINKLNVNKDNNDFKSLNTTNTAKLVNNGKEIKDLDLFNGKNIEPEEVQNTHILENQHKIKSKKEKADTERQNSKELSLDQAISDYMKTYSMNFLNKYNRGSFFTKRLKRQLKIHYMDNQVTTVKSKRAKEKSKQQDDELYVEIETHFDGKGIKGEKKKKLVRTLIDKIQKALNSNAEVFNQDKNIQQTHLQIKKRMQNPIDPSGLIVTTQSPVDAIEQRQLNPISKTANIMQPLSSVLDKSGETWKKIYNGPGFLTPSKSVNSAEMRELDIDYSKVTENGIPKRLQKPINTEIEDLLNRNEYTNMGNITLYLKDINGSGFSIGINQYTDEPPDIETLKMFSGLENVIQAYHQRYDQDEEVSNESYEQLHYIPNNIHEIKRRDVTKRNTINNQWISTYRNIEREEHENNNEKYITQKPSYKRSSINVKLFSNIKSKTKLNKFINTNAMATKKIFRKSKRNKRQLGKIKLIASDRYPPTSREDVILVSRENIYADRAVIKEETPEVEIGDTNEEHYNFLAPYSYNMDIPNIQSAYISRSFDSTSLHNGLMSRYPHLFLDNISRSKDFMDISPSNEKLNAKSTVYEHNDAESNEKNMSSTSLDDIVNAVIPARNNFKVVVKIFPKNNTHVGAGYKEVHTLINKSYDKNGLRYTSSLNVSEISKLESLNITKPENKSIENKSTLEQQQSQIKMLLELHKNRIDQQLEHLKMESQKLKQMLLHEKTHKNISQVIDIFRQSGLKPSYGRIFSPSNENTNMHVTTISNTFLVKSERTTNTLFASENKQEDTEKKNILSSLKESENITRTILNKIDNNTNILQSFLQKLLDQKQSAFLPIVSTEKNFNSVTPKHLVSEQLIHPFLEQLHKNYTNAIPFIYAFQHPITEYKNKPQTVANVVYHGHIHADKVNNDKKSNNFLKITNDLKAQNNKNLNTNNGRHNVNETRFFIDELENDFKLISNANDRIPVFTTIKSNTTKN